MKKIMSRNEIRILVMLAFFSLSVGLWNSFRELWLQSNNLRVSDISNLLSIASLISAVCIFFSATKIKLSKIQKFIIISLILKIIVMLLLFIINKSNNNNIMLVLIIMDVVLEKFVIIGIYPFIVNIKKDDLLYSKRKLVEYLFRDVGILIGGIFIGKQIFSLIVDYNVCLLISMAFLILSTLMFISIKNVVNNKISKVSFKYILKDKINVIYLAYYFFGNIAFYVGLGLKMLMLTNKLSFSINNALNYLLVVGLVADIIGIIVLKYLTPKNDYLSISIKFGIRCMFYICAFLTNNLFIIFLAITWSLLISTAYENKTDAPYINMIEDEYQLFFTDIRYVVGMVAASIGMYLAGLTYSFGINYMLGLSALFMLVQILLAYYLVYLRKNRIN